MNKDKIKIEFEIMFKDNLWSDADSLAVKMNHKIWDFFSKKLDEAYEEGKKAQEEFLLREIKF